jgi:hypothetical protein
MAAPNGKFRQRFQCVARCKERRRKINYFFFSENVIICRQPASSKRDVRVVTIRGGGLRWT